RLAKAVRLRPFASDSDNTKLGTNIVPKQMGYDEMVEEYCALYYRLLTDRNIAARIKNKTRYLGNPIYNEDYPAAEVLKMLGRFFVKGLLPGGLSRLFFFMRSIPFSAPRLIPIVVRDWITGLSMRDYVDRHFVLEFDKVNQLTYNYLKQIEQLFQRYLNLGALEVSLNHIKNKAAELTISMKIGVDQKFFVRVAHHLEQILKNTTSSITLHIEELHEAQHQNLNNLLKKLSRYGDRVTIAMSAKLRGLIEIDSSVFNLVFEY
ncbi:MAG: DUF4070 domain-containing protein, partial [bacterium]